MAAKIASGVDREVLFASFALAVGSTVKDTMFKSRIDSEIIPNL